MHKGSLTSGMALKNPFHEYITIENDFLKIPLLEGIFTDSHFTERARLGRLIIFLARTASEFQRSNLWGVGIDEETALLIESDGEGKILSTKDGTVSLIQISPPIPSLEEGVNLTKLQSIVILLGKDSSINLKNLHVDNPLAVEKIQTLENRLERSSEN
jgi:beta-aspartyl-peptidase (threonine type)